MTPARTSKLAGTVFWPDGTTRFNGHVDIVLMVPGIDGRTQLWPRLSIGQGYPSVEIPQWTRVKITDGVFDQGVALWYNSDIIPHNTKYVAHYYDSSSFWRRAARFISRERRLCSASWRSFSSRARFSA